MDQAAAHDDDVGEKPQSPPSPVASNAIQTTGSGFEAMSTVAAGVKDAESGDKGKLHGSLQQGGGAR